MSSKDPVTETPVGDLTLNLTWPPLGVPFLDMVNLSAPSRNTWKSVYGASPGHGAGQDLAPATGERSQS